MGLIVGVAVLLSYLPCFRAWAATPIPTSPLSEHQHCLALLVSDSGRNWEELASATETWVARYGSEAPDELHATLIAGLEIWSGQPRAWEERSSVSETWEGWLALGLSRSDMSAAREFAWDRLTILARANDMPAYRRVFRVLARVYTEPPLAVPAQEGAGPYREAAAGVDPSHGAGAERATTTPLVRFTAMFQSDTFLTRCNFVRHNGELLHFFPPEYQQADRIVTHLSVGASASSARPIAEMVEILARDYFPNVPGLPDFWECAWARFMAWRRR